MITKSEAREMLSRQLNENRPPEREIVVSEGVDKAYGWVFFYQSKRHLETGETRYALAGSIHELGSGLPPEEMIARYERARSGG